MRLGIMMVAGAVVCAGGLAHASEKKIAKTDIPAPVQAAMDEQSKGATVRGYNVEIEDGKTFYELETNKNGKSRDLLFEPSGKIAEIEEETDLASVPTAVKAAIEKNAPAGAKVKIEAGAKGGTEISYYEVHATTGTSRVGFHVALDGSVSEKKVKAAKKSEKEEDEDEENEEHEKAK